MAIDPNLPPTGRDRLNTPNMATGPVTTVRTSSSSGWMIALVVLAIVVMAGFFMWPDRASNVAGRDPVTTGTTMERAIPAPAAAPTPTPTPVQTPAPASPSNAAPTAPR